MSWFWIFQIPAHVHSQSWKFRHAKMPGAAGLRRRVWMTGKTGRGMRPWPRAPCGPYTRPGPAEEGPYTRLLYNIQYSASHPRGSLGSDGQMRKRRKRNWELWQKEIDACEWAAAAICHLVFLPLHQQHFFKIINYPSVQISFRLH